MKVIRKFNKEVKKFKIGDQITLGRYTATAVAQDETGTTFCLDQVYGEKPMGYGDGKRIKALYNSKMFDSVRDLMVSFVPDEEGEIYPSCVLRSPTAEEIWAKQSIHFIQPTVLDGAKTRWSAMKDTRYRLGFDVNGVIRAYWVDSVVNIAYQAFREDQAVIFGVHDGNIQTRVFEPEQSKGSHVIVSINGLTGTVDPEDPETSVYMRPVFKLRDEDHTHGI